MTQLGEWQNFYVIVGSAAGALTGLQFVVMALISEMPLQPGDHAGYTLLVVRRMRRQTAYKPVLEDWVFHALLPICAYVGLCAAAMATHTHARSALFGIAGVVLLLLVVGIHNAWDNVTYLVILKRERLHAASSSNAPCSE